MKRSDIDCDIPKPDKIDIYELYNQKSNLICIVCTLYSYTHIYVYSHL